MAPLGFLERCRRGLSLQFSSMCQRFVKLAHYNTLTDILNSLFAVQESVEVVFVDVIWD